MELAILICTYNRADLLRLAIESCCQQKGVAPSDYEIIVVDNNCTDHTPQVVAEMQAAYPHVALRRVEEPIPGLSQARNTGLRACDAPLIAYLDDDAKAACDYVAHILHLHHTLQPSAGVLCGPILSFAIATPPPWFKVAYEEMHAAPHPHDLDDYEQFWGSNMVWQRPLLERLGGFPLNLGFKGDSISRAGEEVYLLSQLRTFDPPPRLYYDPSLKVYHYIPDYKMTVAYRLKRRAVIGQSTYYVYFAHLKLLARAWKAGGALKGLLVELVKALLAWNQYPYREQWQAEAWGNVIEKYGLLLSFLGMSLRLKR